MLKAVWLFLSSVFYTINEWMNEWMAVVIRSLLGVASLYLIVCKYLHGDISIFTKFNIAAVRHLWFFWGNCGTTHLGPFMVAIPCTQDGFIHIAANGWISVNTEEKKNKHYIQQVRQQDAYLAIRMCAGLCPTYSTALHDAEKKQER